MELEYTSKQIADLCGVSVRTLRHYHQIGLIPEPDRTYGGYRIYTPEHVLQLLRIQRLTGLGLSLVQTAAVLDDPAGASAAEILDDLDRALADRIAAMQAQRQILASMRQADAPVDVLPAFAQHLSTLRALGEPEEALEAEKMAIDIVAGLGTERDLALVRETLDAATHSGTLQRMIDLDQRLQRIDEDTPEAEVASFTEEFEQVLIDFQTEHAASRGTADQAGTQPARPLDDIIASLHEAHLNPRQREIVRRVTATLAGRGQ